MQKSDTDPQGTHKEKPPLSRGRRPQKKPSPPTPLFIRHLASNTVTKEVSVAQGTPAVALLCILENSHPMVQVFLTGLMMVIQNSKWYQAEQNRDSNSDDPHCMQMMSINFFLPPWLF